MKRALLFFFLSLLLAGWAEQGQADIFLTVESPAQNQILTGITGLSGWTFSTIPNAHMTVQATIDGQPTINGLKVSEVLCCTVRDDVSQLFPTVPQARFSGFALVFNVNYLSEGTHLVVIQAQDDVGSPPQQENRTFSVVKPGGFTLLSSLLIDKNSKLTLSTDKKTVLVTGAVATDNDTGSAQAVNLQLGWQEASQSFGVISSQNVGKPTAGGSGEEGSDDNDTDPDDPTKPPITVTLENPSTTTTTIRGGIGPVSGWTFTRSPNAAISVVHFRLDGALQSDFPCCVERPDVLEEFNNRPQALDSGFGILTNFNQLTTGVHNFGIDVQDSAGVTQSALASMTVVKVANAELLDMFDLSAAQVSLNGSSLELETVTVRDKATQQTTQITADYLWDASCQCFTVQTGCGNGSIDSGEECDGATLGAETCGSLGLPGGALACRPRCAANDKKCTLPCFFELYQTCTGGPLIYVTNVSSNSVSVIDPLAADTKEVTATIKVGREPRGMAATPDGKTIYVANFADKTVSVINTATNTVIATLKVGKGPVGVTMSPDGAFAYVVNGLKNSISIIDTTTNTVIKKTIGVGKKPQNLVLSPDGSQGYVTNFGNNSISFLDMVKRKRAKKNLVVGKGPNGLALSPQGDRLYVVNFNNDSLSVVDTATRKVVKTVPVGSQPTKVTLSQDGAQAYVSNSASSTISIFNTFDFSSAGSLTVSAGNSTDSEPDGMLLTLGEKRLFVTLFGNGLGSEVGIFSTMTDLPLKTIKVGLGPFTMVAIPGR